VGPNHLSTKTPLCPVTGGVPHRTGLTKEYIEPVIELHAKGVAEPNGSGIRGLQDMFVGGDIERI